jgi:hypothetical protein
MSTLKECPNCHRKPGSGSYFTIYKCKDCGRYYCYQCPGSNSGSRCPHCYSQKRSEYTRVSG